MIKVNVETGYQIVDYSKNNENFLLVEIKGEKVEAKKERPPLSIVALLDISSSMSPEYKIGYLKKSVIKLIENLSDKDNLSIIPYSTNAHVAMHLTEMTYENKLKAIKIVNDLEVDHMTNISEALTFGYNEFRKNILDQGINRVILFTDGCPTTGNTDEDFLINLISKRPEGVQITTMGYGNPNECFNRAYNNGMSGELNVRLLQQMAEKGNGNYYYIDSPDACGKAFANELAGLLTTVAQNLKISIEENTDMRILEVVDDIDVKEINGQPVIVIPDIFSGETKYVLIKIETFKKNDPFDMPQRITMVKVEYSDIINGEIKVVEVDVELIFDNKNFSEDLLPKVKSQLEIIRTLEAQEKAMKLAAEGKFSEAKNLMIDYCAVLENIDDERAKNHSMVFNDALYCLSNEVDFNKERNRLESTIVSVKKSRAGGGFTDHLYETTAQKELQEKFIEEPSNPQEEDNKRKQDQKLVKKSSIKRW